MKVKAIAGENFRKTIAEPVAISFGNNEPKVTTGRENKIRKAVSIKANTSNNTANEIALALAGEIVKDARNGDLRKVYLKFRELEKSGSGNSFLAKIKEKIAVYRQELKGLSFIQRAQEYLSSDKQDGLLHPETLYALQDLVIAGDNARSAGNHRLAEEINDVIEQFSGNIQKIKNYSQVTKNFQVLLGLPENEQNGKIDQDILMGAAELYGKTEKDLKQQPGKKDLGETMVKVKSFLANLELKTSGEDFKAA